MIFRTGVSLKILDDSMREKAGTDKFAALNLIMNESWNYRWGQPELIEPDPKEEIIPIQPEQNIPTQIGQDIPSPIPTTPTSTQGPLIETVEREEAPRTEGPLTTQRTEIPSETIGEGTELIETVSRTTKAPTISTVFSIDTPNADIVNDMFKAMGLTEDEFTKMEEREATRRGGTGRTGRTGKTGIQRAILGRDEMPAMSTLTEDPLIKTIPRLRGQ